MFALLNSQKDGGSHVRLLLVFVVFLATSCINKRPPPAPWNLTEPTLQPDEVEGAHVAEWESVHPNLVFHPISQSVKGLPEWQHVYWKEKTYPDRQTPYEFIVEFQPTARMAGLPVGVWKSHTWVGLGGPFLAEDGTLHLYECGLETSVYHRPPFLFICAPYAPNALLLLADDLVSIPDLPRLPPRLHEWWRTSLAMSIGDEDARRAAQVGFPYFFMFWGERDVYRAEMTIDVWPRGVPGARSAFSERRRHTEAWEGNRE